MDEEGNFSPSISFKFNIPDNYDPNLEYKLKLANLELFKFNGNVFDDYGAGREVIFAWPESADYMEMIQEGEIQLNISNNGDTDAQQTGGRKKNIKRKSHKRKSHKRKSHKLKSKRKKSKSKRR